LDIIKEKGKEKEKKREEERELRKSGFGSLLRTTDRRKEREREREWMKKQTENGDKEDRGGVWRTSEGKYLLLLKRPISRSDLKTLPTLFARYRVSIIIRHKLDGNSQPTAAAAAASFDQSGSDIQFPRESRAYPTRYLLPIAAGGIPLFKFEDWTRSDNREYFSKPMVADGTALWYMRE